MDASEFSDDPGRFGFFVLEFGNANLLAFLASGAEGFLREVRADCVLRDDLRGDAEDVRCGAIVFRKGNAERSGIFTGLPARKTLEEKLKAAEGGAAKTVDGLVVVADCENVFAFAGQEFEEAELRDVRVLKFVDEDVAEFVLQRRPNGRIFFEQVDGTGDQGTERDAFLFAEKFFAGAIGTGDFELFLGLFETLFIGVVIQRRAFAFELSGEVFGVTPVILPGDEFILATGEEFHEVVEKLARFGEAPIFVELKPRHAAAQENPVIDFVEQQAVGSGVGDQRFAERVERGEHYVLAAFASGFDDAGFHFAGGFVGERQAEDVFAGKGIVGFEQVANALGDDARFSRTGAGDDE